MQKTQKGSLNIGIEQHPNAGQNIQQVRLYLFDLKYSCSDFTLLLL